ncbi:MAG TPA: carboxypeptidase-like regulatory domain-containing protein, partial [Terriglobia bacterium]|nr:carboxypeptidase-like regulatory domain-containing protein [Terriglobia bacterium]
MKTLGVALIAALIQGASIEAPQQVPVASIAGNVVKWGTADRLSEVIVELRAEGGARPVASTATSENGEFVFPNVAAGRYRVFATRSGFAPAEYGRRRPNGAGQGISLAPGERRSGLQIAMTEGATVYGRISDRNGQPLPFADVRIEKVDYKSGRAALVPVQTAITNDLGEYRIFWIAPGQYYIRASANNNQTYGGTMLVNPGGADTSGATWGATTRPTARVTRPVGLDDGELYAPLYYPSVPSIENASLVELRAGMERNASFTMIPARTREVRGVVVDQSTGQPVQSGLRASLYPIDRYTQTGGTTLQFNPDNGAFRFSGVRSGAYELIATAGDLTGRLVVDVPDRDVNVTVNVSPPPRLSGRVRFEGQPPTGFPADLSRVLEIVIRGTSQLTAGTTATGEFEFQKVPVGNYQIGVQPFAPLMDLP